MVRAGVLLDDVQAPQFGLQAVAAELAEELEQKGYEWIEEEVAAAR